MKISFVNIILFVHPVFGRNLTLDENVPNLNNSSSILLEAGSNIHEVRVLPDLLDLPSIRDPPDPPLLRDPLDFPSIRDPLDFPSIRDQGILRNGKQLFEK